jgi:outer membrane biosynthesis protein TonB
MFTSLHPDSHAKQPVTFIASLILQYAVLAVLCRIPYQQMSGPSLRSNVTHSSSVTPIYFNKEVVTSPSDPASAASRPAPATPPEVKPTPAQQANTQAETSATADAKDDASGDGDQQGLAPFPGWRMNAMSSMSGGFAGMHHQIKEALPVFTPDPPILHTGTPEFARGKDVVLDVLIDSQGSIIEVGVLKGVGNGVESSIVETLRRWIYVPAKFNGVAIVSRQQLHFHFPG